MSDFLLELGQNPQARRLVKSLGLPIPLPERLRRDGGPWTASPLKDQSVVFGAGASPALAGVVAAVLPQAGANPFVADPALLGPFADPGETFGRPARPADTLKEGERVAALVFDASGIDDAEGLKALYTFFHPWVSRVARSGRVLVLGRPPAGLAPDAALAQGALDGFVRSVAKEIGRTGATANLVLVDKGAEGRAGAVLRFLLSARSAFVTAQPIVLSNRAKGGTEPPLVRPLEKKVVLVTGAARGIGAAAARLFAQEGAHVVCLDRPADDGPTSQLARDIGGTPLLVDMADEGAPSRILSALADKGGVDVVVHNAGVTRDKTLARMGEEQWDSLMRINLAAVARTTHVLLESGTLKEGGRIIALSSISGIAGNVGQTNYAASKAGLIAFVRALSEKVASKGITVNAVAPGFIETRLTAAIPVAVREVARRMAALGQGGLPEDVGQAIVFLASPGAQGITGSVLRVCGGSLVGA